MSPSIYINDFWKELGKKTIGFSVGVALGYVLHYAQTKDDVTNVVPISELEQIIQKYQPQEDKR